MPRRAGPASDHFSDELISENLLLSDVPSAFTAAMIASEMPAAIRPYSMAVAPDSSFTKRRMSWFMVKIPSTIPTTQTCSGTGSVRLPQLIVGTSGQTVNQRYKLRPIASTINLPMAAGRRRSQSDVLALAVTGKGVDGSVWSRTR